MEQAGCEGMEEEPTKIPDTANESSDRSDELIGSKGRKTNGSETVGNSKQDRGRIDVENLDPGKRPGDVHYHEPNGTKWRYDIDSGRFVSPKTGIPAPKHIQKLLQQRWVQIAIRKALKILGVQ